MTEPLAVLIGTTVVTAAFHTLIPDHWLPFVLVARARGWDARRTAALTAGSALLHVVISVGMGIGAHLLGRGAEAATGLGESFERISAGLLTLFGVAYAGWFLLKGGHQHSFGMHPHHAPGSPHPPGTTHPHDLAAAGAAGRGRAATAPGRPGRPWDGVALAGIVGFNPCVLVIPYIYYAGSLGTAALAAVAAAFAATTILCMVGVALLGLRGTARLESPFLMRYGEAVSGAIIALTGLAVLIAGR